MVIKVHGHRRAYHKDQGGMQCVHGVIAPSITEHRSAGKTAVKELDSMIMPEAVQEFQDLEECLCVSVC